MMTTRTYRASAFLRAAGRLRVPVVVGSEKPQSLAAAVPAAHLTLPFARPAEAVRRIREFAGKHPVAAVLAADDEGAVLAARAAQALGLRHAAVEAVRAARDKHRMREVLARAGLRSPRYHRIGLDEDPREAGSRVGYPLVVKPLSLAASRGVIRADDPGQLVAACRRAAAIVRTADGALAGEEGGRWLLLEGYIPGEEIALEGVLARGRLQVLALFDKRDPLNGSFFEESIYVTPSCQPAEVREQVVGVTASALHVLGLKEGAVHAELRINEEGPWILEIAPRSIGGLCSRTLRFEGGATLEEILIRHALGLPVASHELYGGASGVMMIPVPYAGVLRGVSGRAAAREVAGIEDLLITAVVGGRLVPLPEGSRYLGFIFARAERPDEVEAALREAHRRLVFDIDPMDSSRPAG
ncbi:MAG: ATP-grasp domain-containing protein [Acidobacteriota bacterium]